MFIGNPSPLFDDRDLPEIKKKIIFDHFHLHKSLVSLSGPENNEVQWPVGFSKLPLCLLIEGKRPIVLRKWNSRIRWVNLEISFASGSVRSHFLVTTFTAEAEGRYSRPGASLVMSPQHPLPFWIGKSWIEISYVTNKESPDGNKREIISNLLQLWSYLINNKIFL